MNGAQRNIALYPWFKFAQNLLFWQAIWFLFFQAQLSAAEAIVIYAFYEVSTTTLEVPSGYVSDRIGRRLTLIISGLAGVVAGLMLTFGDGFWVFALAQIPLGAHMAFASGTDTSLLYESLRTAGRDDEVEAQELRAFRFTFVALGISAVAGGLLAMADMRLAYLASTGGFMACFAISLFFVEPERETMKAREIIAGINSLLASFRKPVVLWLFGLSVLMYAYSHIPFVFGQPFILAALAEQGIAANAPVISGAISAGMMLLSVAVSQFVPAIRERFSLTQILLGAFAFQIAVGAGMALSGSVLVIAILFFRMVPSAFTQPLIVARLQPLLSDDSRATFLSLKSLVGRMGFALSLLAASVSASEVGAMAQEEIRAIVLGYAVAGILALLVFAALSRNRDV